MNRNWFVIFVVAQVINILLFSWINCVLKFGFRLDFLESVSEILWTCERWQRYLSVYEISWLTVTHTFSFFPTLVVWWRLFSIQFFRYFSFFLKNNMTDFSLVSALFRKLCKLLLMHGGLTFEWFDMRWYLSITDERYDIWSTDRTLFLAKLWDIHKAI